MKNFTKISKMIVVVLLSLFAFTQTQAQCDYQIALYDSYGDGWNGGIVSVFVDGTEVLDDITLAAGAGPEFHTFPVATGAEITTTYSPGGWSYENMYEIIDSEGNVVWTEGASGTPGNIGPGMLFATCPSPPCDYEIALYDDWGDGWNGGTVSVYVDGTVVLNNITLAWGTGPEYYTFQVTTGAEITTTYSPGGWSYENEYHIIDAMGTVVWIDGGGGTTPTGIGPGLLFGNCPSAPGSIEGYVMNGQGLAIGGADVYVELIPAWAAVTNPGGYYIINDVQPATWNVVASRTGYWNDTTEVTVISGDTVAIDFVLTRPQITINPLLMNQTLHPNQYLIDYFGILNTGDGPLEWTAQIIFPPSDGETNPIHVPAFTGEIEKVREATSIKAAPENTQKGEIINPVYLDNILGDNDGWIGAPSDDKLYVMDMGTYTSTLVGSTITDPCSGDFLNNEDQIMYAAGNWGANLYEVDVTTGAGTLIAAFSGAPYNVSGMATDRTSGTMYVCGTNVSASYIGTLDVATGVITQVGSNITNAPGLIDIAIDGAGQMYGWCIVTDASYTIDKATGIATTLGSLGFNANYGQGGNWDQNDDVIYLTAYNSAAGAQLRALDPVSGATVLLSGLPATQCAAFGVPGGGAGGGWLSLGSYSGTVAPNGGSFNLDAHFNAEGFVAGDYVTADIVFTTNPDVGTITVPVTMTVLGFPFSMPYNLVATLNMYTGEVDLTWEFDGDVFQYFIVYRDGVFAGSTTDQFYTDYLTDYGIYCYTVVAYYDEGQTAPAGPECVDWLIPDFCWDPAHPEEWVWTESEEFVDLIVTNCGQGILEYTFPEYVALDLVNDPDIEQNQIGDPFAGQETTVAKGENDPRDNGGYPIVLGAGGPDAYGYVWIDSDEAGGPTYEWFEISAIGTDHGLSGDDNYVTINIPFTFEFYGDNKTSFKASTNGYLTFGSDGTDYSNDPIPSTTDPDDFLAAFWDDLNFTGAAKLYSYHDAANNRFIVQYTSVPRLGSSSINTFQYHLYESNGKIAFMYQDMNGTLTSATIGIENVDGSVGLQVAYNTAYVHDNLAVLISLPAHFIIDVVPAYGTLIEGESETVVMTYSSVGYDVGDYNEDLECLTNALAPNDVVFIPNTMHVYQPAEFAGTVTDGNTGAPIGGVEVTAGTWQTMTAPDGTYSIVVDPGDYFVDFEIVGFQDVTIDTSALAGVVTPLDVQMFEEAYPPGFVLATVNEDDTQCAVEWSLPWGPYLIVYDDGSADDYFVWASAGNANAVKFTPAGYPATIIGGKIYVGDGSFPVGANFIGTTFGAVVYDDDGADGLPGTQLDSIEVTVDNYGWVDFSGLSATIEDGDFFIAMFQGGTPPNTAPVGIDYTIPTVYRSYSYDAVFDVWALSAYQDFMIRAIVTGPQSDDGMAESTEIVYPIKPVKQNFLSIHTPKGIPGTVKSGEFIPITDGAATNRDVVSYTIGRYYNFDPNDPPTTGDFDVLATGLTALTYNDAAFGGLPMGWYAYGVRAHYTNGDFSDYTVSNVVGHLMDVQVIINVTLTTGDSPEGAVVNLYAHDYPYQDHFIIMDATGTDTLEFVWKGCYDISAFHIGYEPYYVPNHCFFADEILDIILLEKRYPPYNLYVDPLTSIATWNEPRITALLEDFNGSLFPPEGWTSETESIGWFATFDGSGPNWPVPAHDTQYACANDDAAGSTANGCCDYLITPPLDLRESEGYSLKFESYYDGAYGQLAFVEYSLDAGATWEVLSQLSAASAWADLEMDLSAYSGMTGPSAIWLAFHADDDALWASGWAIDNVEVSVGSADWPPMGYHVFLDGGYVDFTEETTYQYEYLTYGVEYEASVGALYTSGLSAKDYYVFTSRYLIPPRNLQGMSPTGTDYAYLVWLPPVEPASEGDYTIISEEIRTEMPNKNAEYSPTVRVIEGEGSGRDQWDVQYNFPVAGSSPCEAGTESDGSYIYSGWWNGTPFFKYDLDGTYLGEFTISGVSSIRDYAYDGTYFYGAAANTSVRIMDFDNQELIGTINAPTACRAIAYDEQMVGFWCNNWSTDITLFDMTGAQLNSFPVGAFGSFYGFAYDDWTEGGPYLWGQSQDGSGAEIVQIEIATGAQIFNFNVLPIVGGTQIAGGMYSHCELIDPGLATLGGILQCELLYGLELVACSGGGGGDVPENLLGFNTYRYGVYQDYVEWIPGNANTLVDWYDFGLEPAVYEYTVTAVYDLEPYGLPGETAESMEEGPVSVTVTYGYPLPFFEDWQNGTFEFNEWTTGCDNWRVNGQIGNPLPSAEFQWDPLLTDYECGLISYPLLAIDMIDGDIWLDFDLMLDSRFDTAVDERFIVKVWENGTWHAVAEFINEGDMDWTSNHIDITSIAKGADFRLGFFAAGLNSVDIIGWYVDNIHVYRLCAPPFDLEAIIDEYNTEAYVYLNWIPPGATEGEWISYNDGTFENAIASTDGGAGLAQIFTPPQYPCTVTKVRFFVSGYGSYFQDEEVYVLTGDGATILAGPYVVPGVEDDWITIDVDPVTITEGTFMVATFNVLPDGPFIGIDDSYYDATLYFGSIGAFTELGEYGYFYIGSHEAYVEYAISDNVVVNSVLTSPQSNGSRAGITESNTFSNGTLKPTRDLLGYNIFRNVDFGDFELIDYTTDTIYTDTLYTGGWYCYYTTAVYDQCESDSSNNACVLCTVGIEELDLESTISVYPNPASDFVNVVSTEAITRITVINYVGQIVYEKKVSDETSILLNTASYETGVYMIKVETDDMITVKRVTITR